MIGVKATVLPFFEFLAPHKAGQPLYLVPERAAVLCLAEVIIARDRDTGEEKPVWGTDESERLEAGEDLQCGPVLVVELSFAYELESLIDLVTAVRCVNDAEDGAEDDNEVDDAEDASDLEDDEDDDEEEDDAEDDLDDESDLDDEWEEVGDDDDDDAEDDDEDDEDDQPEPTPP